MGTHIHGNAASHRALADAVRRYGVVRSTPSKRVLCYQGDPSDAFYLVLEGRLNQIKHRSDGSDLLVATFEEGSWVGLVEAYLDAPYLADVVAEGPSELLAFSKGTASVLRTIPGVTDTWLDSISRIGYRLHAAIGNNTPMAALCSYLLSRSVALPTNSDPREGVLATQEQIATELGFTRETVNRYLKELEADGQVRVNRGVVELLDRERLAEPQIL